MYRFTWDEEDRLTQTAYPGGITDTFTYSGLGLRVGKTDSAGTYSYLCDVASPGSDVLSDGHAIYMPGLSENRAGVSGYYSNDQQGNLWTIDGSGKTQTTYADFSGFGGIIAGDSRDSPSGSGNGCLLL